MYDFSSIEGILKYIFVQMPERFIQEGEDRQSIEETQCEFLALSINLFDDPEQRYALTELARAKLSQLFLRDMCYRLGIMPQARKLEGRIHMAAVAMADECIAETLKRGERLTDEDKPYTDCYEYFLMFAWARFIRQEAGGESIEQTLPDRMRKIFTEFDNDEQRPVLSRWFKTPIKYPKLTCHGAKKYT